jgi:hypothetical protein
MQSPFTVLLATQWINDGTSADVLDSIRDEAAARQAIASAELRGLAFDADPQWFHLWLPVPSMCDWSPPELALQLRNQASARWPAPRFPPMAIRRMRCACVSAGRRIARIAAKR